MTIQRQDDSGQADPRKHGCINAAAVLWALDEAPCVPARLVSTLIAVARYAGEHGRGAYPSGATIAAQTRKSEAQAKKDIAELAKLGLLLPGDDHLVSRIRGDRRPNVWDVPLWRGSPRRAPSDDSRGSSKRASSTRSRGSSGTRTGLSSPQNGARPDEPEENLNKPEDRRRGAKRAARPSKPPWCGQCDERTRLTGDDHPQRCPRCHPLSDAQ